MFVEVTQNVAPERDSMEDYYSSDFFDCYNQNCV